MPPARRVEISPPEAMVHTWTRHRHEETQEEVRHRPRPPEHAGDGWTLEHVGGRTVAAGDEEDADGSNGPGQKREEDEDQEEEESSGEEE